SHLPSGSDAAGSRRLPVIILPFKLREGLPMRIVITGGAGFLGVRLARAILAGHTLTDARGAARPIREVVLLDVVAPPDLGDARARAVPRDLAAASVVERAITADTDSIFHLAAVVSGQAEADFDIG